MSNNSAHALMFQSDSEVASDSFDRDHFEQYSNQRTKNNIRSRSAGDANSHQGQQPLTEKLPVSTNPNANAMTQAAIRHS
jgi:hypothetical protein